MSMPVPGGPRGCLGTRVAPASIVKEWAVDRIAPRPVLFITTDNDRLAPPEESEHLYARARELEQLVVLRGYGHYELYSEPAFGEVMRATLAWYREQLPARTSSPRTSPR